MWNVWTILTMNVGLVVIMRPDELPFVVRCSRRISKESSSRRTMRRVLNPFLYLRSINRRTTKILPKFAHTDNASLV